jgi:hypothetical protein
VADHDRLGPGVALRTKTIDELVPSDALHLIAELEANQAMAEEHSFAEGGATVTRPGERPSFIPTTRTRPGS